MRRRAATTVLAGLILTACGTGTGTGTAGTAGNTRTSNVQTSAAPTSTAETSVPAALRFSADVVGGGQIDFRSYAGKAVALWFWAPT